MLKVCVVQEREMSDAAGSIVNLLNDEAESLDDEKRLSRALVADDDFRD
jgi:hypothetical protein